MSCTVPTRTMQSSEQAGGGRVEVALSASADRAVEEPPHEPTKIPPPSSSCRGQRHSTRIYVPLLKRCWTGS